MASTAGSVPLFQQVARVLRQRLRDGTYPVGIPLPGERELTREFGVARTTIRSALTRLQEEGCITRLRGQGTLPVARPSTARHSKIRNGLLQNILRFGQRTRTTLVSAQYTAADSVVAHALRVSPGSRVMRVVRVRKSHRTPLLCTEAYLPPAVAEGIVPPMLEDIPLLEAIERAGHPFAQGEQELIAVIASAEVAGRDAADRSGGAVAARQPRGVGCAGSADPVSDRPLRAGALPVPHAPVAHRRLHHGVDHELRPRVAGGLAASRRRGCLGWFGSLASTSSARVRSSARGVARLH